MSKTLNISITFGLLKWGDAVARMSFKAGDDYALKLSRLATSAEEIAKRAIYEGAKIVADEIKARIPENTGDLAESFGVTPIDRDADGNWNAKVGFDGYDRDGVPNQLKARAIENGTSTIPAKPFVRPAVRKTRRQVMKKMKQVIDDEIEKMKL